MGHLALKRAIRNAEANDLVARKVAALADTPEGQQGRPSKSLTLEQAMRSSPQPKPCRSWNCAPARRMSAGRPNSCTPASC
jgi:hypothetical protein